MELLTWQSVLESPLQVALSTMMPCSSLKWEVFSFERESRVATLDPQKHTLLVRAGSNSDLMKQLIFSWRVVLGDKHVMVKEAGKWRGEHNSEFPTTLQKRALKTQPS
ncbi:uncharacterized protein LOC144616005 [Panthera onca]